MFNIIILANNILNGPKEVIDRVTFTDTPVYDFVTSRNRYYETTNEGMAVRDKEPAVLGTIFEDTFTGVDGTIIQSRASDSGHQWYKLGYLDAVIAGNQAVISDIANMPDSITSYAISAMPVDTTYDTEIVVSVLTLDAGFELCAFLDGYDLGFYRYAVSYSGQGTGLWSMYQVLPGIGSVGQQYVIARIPINTPKLVKLSRVGTVLSLYVDNVLVTSYTLDTVVGLCRPGFTAGSPYTEQAVKIDRFTITSRITPIALTAEYLIAKPGNVFDALTLGISLTPQTSTNNLLTETATSTDTIIGGVAKVIDDLLTASDTILSNWNSHHSFYEDLTVVDSQVTIARAYLPALAEICALNETLAYACGFKLQDIVHLVEQQDTRWVGSKTVADFILCADAATTANAYIHFIADLIASSDANTQAMGVFLWERFTSADTPLSQWVGSRAVAEILPLVDRGVLAGGVLRALEETISTSETIVSALSYLLRDILNLQETAGTSWQGAKQLAELVTFVGLTISSKGFYSGLEELVTLLDTPLLVFALACIAQDGIITSETAGHEYQTKGVLTSAISISELTITQGGLSNSLSDEISFSIRVILGGEVYQCWSFATGDMMPSVFTNFNFNSYVNTEDKVYAAKEEGIFLLEGGDDAGVKIESGVVMNFASIGTHLQKRLYHAYFGLVGEAPALRVITDSNTVDYYVVQGKGSQSVAHLSRGVQGREWELILTDIDALDFVEISPVILSR